MRLCPAILCLLPLFSPLHAHDLHQSTAEAEYNPKTQKLEVSLTAFISDLELALIRHTERLISFDKTPAAELDAAIQSYLAKTFVVTDAAGKVVTLEWIGRELDAATAKSGDPGVTLFIEVPLQGAGGLVLQNGVLHDLFKDQTNLLHLQGLGRKAELKFSGGQPPQKLTF